MLKNLSIAAIPLLFAIIFHEIAHGWVANRLGDPTAKQMGRLTINPIVHIDIFGTIIMPIILLIFSHGNFSFGYAKPVPVNPFNLRNPKRDMAIVSFAGPATNIILAAISILLAIIIAALQLSTLLPQFLASKLLIPISQMLSFSATINIFLAAFNLIPIPPLDGGRVLIGLLPDRYAYSFSKIEPFGFMILFTLIILGITDYFVIPIATVIRGLLILIFSPLRWLL
ncbi:MAG: site-2 protease family protein [Nitrospirae bacterium]|nr:site-2 protease family protein [Nitrospirota bacterium]